MLAGIKDVFLICNSLGIQDAFRKQTEPSLSPVPCEGKLAHTSNKKMKIIVTHIKWEKINILVLEL